MKRFPSSIIKSMRATRAMTTCITVEFDDTGWESAVFFELGGKACAADRTVLENTGSPLPIALEADLIENPTAAVVMLRFEVMTNDANPLAGEVLIAPGVGNIQFETLHNLTTQDALRFYFADANYNIIHSQRIGLQDRERAGYKGILDDAISHDAVIRLAGKYDAMAALKEVTSHYASHVEPA